MQQPAESPALGLEFYGHAIRRQWLILVIGAVVGLLVGGVYLLVKPPHVLATTDVSISVITTDPFAATSQSTNILDGTTESSIATSYAVAKAAAADIGGSATANSIRDGVTVDAVSDKNVVHITYAASSAAAARTGADAVASSYLDYRGTQASAKRDKILDGLATTLSRLQSQLTTTNATISSTGHKSSAYNDALSQRDQLVTEINSLVEQRSELEQLDVSGGSILTPASSNPTHQSPNPLVVLLAGLLAGAVVGLIVLFPVNARDRRWRSAREVAGSTSSPLLGDLRSKAAEIPETGASLEVFRTIRERLIAELPADARIIAVIDDTTGPAATDVAANLAITFAQTGRLVELVLPGTPVELQRTITNSLSLGDIPTDTAAVPVGSKALKALTVYFPKAADGASAELITSAVTTHLTSAKTRRLSLLALPPAAPPSSILAALRLCDAVLLVAELDHSHADSARTLIGEAEGLGKPFLGTITVAHGRALASGSAATTPVAESVPAGE